MHEYHTYETYSFIADIGGYLVYHCENFMILSDTIYFQGLCLGASLLTFYDLALEMSGRTMKYVFKRSKKTSANTQLL